VIDILWDFIVWIHEPFFDLHAGVWSDLNIFQHASKCHLKENECVKTDDGYREDSLGEVNCTASFTNPAKNEGMQQGVRNGQETANNRFKQWW
jgi:hypothetical protein